MKWRVVANGAAFVVALALGATACATSSPTTHTTTSAAAGGNALDVLQGIRVENEYPSGYMRSLFAHWKDIDGDGVERGDPYRVRQRHH